MSLPKETDLYPHLKKWLEEQGFTVHGEVHGCDIAAQKDGKLVLVEIKRSINLELIYQIIRRQEVDALVYGAVPAPRDFDNKRWREGVRLFRRLDAGLVIVYTSPDIRVEPLLHPRQIPRGTRKTITRSYLDEMEARTLDANLGGSPGWKNMNSFREKALRIAIAIERFGPSSKHHLCLTGASSMTGSILRRNQDGWFELAAPGVYGLTVKGKAALEKYKPLADDLRLQCRNIPKPQ